MSTGGGDWKEYAKLVMASLEDHEERIKKLEATLMDLKLDMAKVILNRSFIGSISGVLVAAVPAIIYWFFSK